MIKAGELDRRFKLLKQITTKDAMGGTKIVFQPSFGFWAKLMDRPGGLVVSPIGGPSVLAYDIKLFCRFDKRIQHGDRIEYNGDVYAIISLIETERQTELSILASRQLGR